MLRRFHFLLEHIQHADTCQQMDVIVELASFRGVFYRSDRDEGLAWKIFRSDMEQQFGCFVNDSTSTLATINDSPGTGRSVDKHVFQPIGRSIKRLLLALELRYFQPPEKSARRIIKFLEASPFSGRYITDDKICKHSFNKRYIVYDVDERKKRLNCISLFLEISRVVEIAKALQRLLIQAR